MGYRRCSCGAAVANSSVVCPACRTELQVRSVATRTPPISSPVRGHPQPSTWYYMIDGSRYGPVSDDTVAQLLRSGELPKDTLVWAPGMPDWERAEAVSELIQ